MTTTVNWERAFEPLRTEPVEPTEATDTLTYTVSLRQGGDRPEVLARARGLDSLQALLAATELLPGATYRFYEDLDLGRPFVALHRHRTGEGWGQIEPVAYFQ